MIKTKEKPVDEVTTDVDVVAWTVDAVKNENKGARKKGETDWTDGQRAAKGEEAVESRQNSGLKKKMKREREWLTDFHLTLNSSFASLTVVNLSLVVIVHHFDKFT